MYIIVRIQSLPCIAFLFMTKTLSVSCDCHHDVQTKKQVGDLALCIKVYTVSSYLDPVRQSTQERALDETDEIE